MSGLTNAIGMWVSEQPKFCLAMGISAVFGYVGCRLCINYGYKGTSKIEGTPRGAWYIGCTYQMVVSVVCVSVVC